jgi:hypothetical protein
MIKKSNDIKSNLEKMREVGTPRGEDTGFETLNRIYSIKQGSSTFILAAPHHGKSELSFELIFNQAQNYSKKTLVYSPETGSVEDIYAEFIHKYTGKPFYKSMSGAVEDREYYNALSYIDEMFSIVDSDEKSYSFKDLTKLVTDEQIILCDPYNEMRHDMSAYGARQDLYIEDLCGEIRRYCKKNHKHVIQTLHPSWQSKIEGKDINNQKIMYYPMPSAREAAGGQALFRKAMTWINIWRPPVNMANEHGQPYLENEVLIQVEKAKPKGVATRGITSLYFNWHKNRYYEDYCGTDSYAFNHTKKQIDNKVTILQPNFNFDTDDRPF